MRAKSKFNVTSWNEDLCVSFSNNQRTTKANVTFKVEGDMQGTATANWLMYYNYYDESNKANSTATYVGFIHFEGKLGEKTGSFILEDKGTYIRGTAKSNLVILTASGKDGLDQISGKAKFLSTKDGSALVLTYYFNEKAFNRPSATVDELRH